MRPLPPHLPKDAADADSERPQQTSVMSLRERLLEVQKRGAPAQRALAADLLKSGLKAPDDLETARQLVDAFSHDPYLIKVEPDAEVTHPPKSPPVA